RVAAPLIRRLVAVYTAIGASSAMAAGTSCRKGEAGRRRNHRERRFDAQERERPRMCGRVVRDERQCRARRTSVSCATNVSAERKELQRRAQGASAPSARSFSAERKELQRRAQGASAPSARSFSAPPPGRAQKASARGRRPPPPPATARSAWGAGAA